MTVARRITLPTLLIISFLLLSLLVPGGPVENRDFSHIDTLILLVFNIFLTILAFSSLPQAYASWRGARWAYFGALAAGMAYFVVYAIDLIGLFPQSPTPMSSALLLIETAGLVAAFALMFYSYHELHSTPNITTEAVSLRKNPSIWIGVAIIATLIVWFATWSAMHSAT